MTWSAMPVPPCRQDNPVLSLFNGRCRTEGVLDNEPFVNESTFGAFPVQVQGHSHLHDSLEAATCSHDMHQEVGTVFLASSPGVIQHAK